MKKCPTCGKTFDDALRFCQTDGTPLVEDEPAPDPFRTMVVDQANISSSIPKEEPASKEEDVLDLPDESDAMKTMVVSDSERKELFEEKPISAPSSSPFGSPKSSREDDFSPKQPEPPKFSEPSLSPPSFGDLGSKSGESGSSKPPPFEKPERSDDFGGMSRSSEDRPTGAPIPSPFDQSLQPGYKPPAEPPFKEPEERRDEPQSPFDQSPFGSPFGSAEPLNQPMQQSEWTPPPAPEANWQNQEIGQNTSFQPPPAAAGPNQTLAIVSLVVGVLSIFCCGWFIPGIAAIVLGFMAKSKADQNPNEFGGRGLALGGIITGGISILLGIIVVVLYLFTGILSGIVR
ncbi:MAG TPA: DUF4190 domain-containing protein [Pyrinomonadaceae bacterium]|nr:DUF4190 domain-containing protein [Pyrinomonadaceae bacterium]